VPEPIMASGNAFAIASIPANAHEVRRVISKTRMPPSNKAAAIGTASSTRLITITGITGP